jgi:hypothetical protein
MTDPVSAARAARENLARGLAALQSPGVPPQVMSVAEPIAHAMSALHRIESTSGAAAMEAGPAALNAARQALGLLQGHAQAVQHPAIEQAMESIAGSLSLVHGLSYGPAPAPQQQMPYAGTVAMGGPGGAPPPMPQQQYAAPAQQYPVPQQYAAPAPAAYAQQPQVAQQAYHQQPAAPQAAAPAQQWQPAPQAGGAEPPMRVEAALGAHSTTNFYKGLSGNDVIDSGGIFIATYQIPVIGRQLMIKVSMPGGYEFEALGVVRWTRNQTASDADSPPGYGAQFTQISPEGRQLVYRYVRNREPLFHDDL